MKDREDCGGGDDPAKHKYTRVMAFASLGGIFTLATVMVASVILAPELSDALGDVSGVLGSVVVALAGLVGAYMGVTNKWGRGRG